LTLLQEGAKQTEEQNEAAMSAPTLDETGAEDRALAKLEDRRSLTGKTRSVRLYGDRIEVCEPGESLQRIRLYSVTQVRMSVEMAGRDTQVVCRVASKSTQIVFGSRSLSGPGSWQNNAVEFRGLVLALHKALQPRKLAVRFVEGQTLGFRLIMGAAGLSLATGGVVFAGYMLSVAGSAMLAAAALPFIVIGGYLAWVFRPGVPLPYNPDQLIARFERAPEPDAGRASPD
jgi:hypothetical protein